MQNIHDNEIVSYTVDLQKSKITFQTLGGKDNSVPVIPHPEAPTSQAAATECCQ